MGILEYEARRYVGLMKDGGALLAPHGDATDTVFRASDMLRRTGVTEITSSSERRGPRTNACRVA
jgi:hypothetical protein